MGIIASGTEIPALIIGGSVGTKQRVEEYNVVQLVCW